MKPFGHKMYSVLKQLVDSNGCIDDEAARLIAQDIFDIDDALAESAKVYKINPICLSPSFCNCLKIDSLEIKVDRYAVRDEFSFYSVKFGYAPDFNIIVYSDKIDIGKTR